MHESQTVVRVGECPRPGHGRSAADPADETVHGEQPVQGGVVDPHRPPPAGQRSTPREVRASARAMTAIINGQAGRLRLATNRMRPPRRHRVPAARRACAKMARLGQARVLVTVDHRPLDVAAVVGLATHGIFGTDSQGIHRPRPDRPRPTAHGGELGLHGFDRANEANSAGRMVPRRLRTTPCAASCSPAGRMQRRPRWPRPFAGRVTAREARPPRSRRTIFGPKTMSSVPYRRGRLMIASTASGPPQATRTSASPRAPGLPPASCRWHGPPPSSVKFMAADVSPRSLT